MKETFKLLLRDAPLGRTRASCPECGRYKSVRVIKEAGKASASCFGCNTWGVESLALSYEEATRVKGGYVKRIPDKELIALRTIEECEEYGVDTYLKSVQCTHLLARGMLYYHPRLRRVVFSDGISATGRTLDPTVNPKWYIYTAGGLPFYVTKGEFTKTDTIVLVEDCASAGALSKSVDSVALLGTSLPREGLELLKDYSYILVALDQDAISKAQKIRQEIEVLYPGKKVSCLFMEKEFKELTEDRAQQVLDQFAFGGI